MFGCILLVILSSSYTLSTLPVLAQAVGSKTTDSTLSDSDAQPQYKIKSRSVAAVDARVSVARLGVPHKARKSYEQAMDAWGKQDIAGAQRKVEQALKIDPRFSEALVLRGFIKASQRNWQSAEDDLQAAIRNDPSYCPAYIILAGIYNTEGRYGEAQESAQQAISAGADSWTVQYEIARVLIGKGEYENALAVADVALRSKHGSLLHVAKAHALLGLRRYTEAVTELRDYLRYEPAGEGAQDAHQILDRLQTFSLR